MSCWYLVRAWKQGSPSRVGKLTTDFKRSLQFEQDWLLKKNLPRLQASESEQKNSHQIFIGAEIASAVSQNGVPQKGKIMCKTFAMVCPSITSHTWFVSTRTAQRHQNKMHYFSLGTLVRSFLQENLSRLFFVKMGQPRPLFHLFTCFQKHITNFTTNMHVKKCPSSIQCPDSNS